MFEDLSCISWCVFVIVIYKVCNGLDLVNVLKVPKMVKKYWNTSGSITSQFWNNVNPKIIKRISKSQEHQKNHLISLPYFGPYQIVFGISKKCRLCHVFSGINTPNGILFREYHDIVKRAGSWDGAGWGLDPKQGLIGPKIQQMF